MPMAGEEGQQAEEGYSSPAFYTKLETPTIFGHHFFLFIFPFPFSFSISCSFYCLYCLLHFFLFPFYSHKKLVQVQALEVRREHRRSWGPDLAALRGTFGDRQQELSRFLEEQNVRLDQAKAADRHRVEELTARHKRELAEEGFIFFYKGFIFFYKGFIFFYTKNYVKTKSYRCAYMGRPPSVVRQMRGTKRNAVKGAGLFCSRSGELWQLVC